MKLFVYILFTCFVWHGLSHGTQIPQRQFAPLDIINAQYESDFLKILEAFPRVNFDTPIGLEQNTPLHLAANQGWSKATQLLLERYANPDTQNAHGQTALYIAVTGNHPETVKRLLEGGAQFAEAEDIARKRNLTNMVDIFENYKQILSQKHASALKSGSNKMARHALEHGMQQTVRGRTSAESQQLSEQTAQYLFPDRAKRLKLDAEQKEALSSIVEEYAENSQK